MADVENQSRNGDAVSTRAPRRSAASNKAWQTLMPHAHKKATDDIDEEEHLEQAPSPQPPAPPAKAASSGSRGGAGRSTPTGGAAAGRKPVAAASAAATPVARAAPAAPQQQQQQQRGLSDDEELEEASSELFPKPPEPVKPPKKRGRPAKNGGAAAAAMEDGSIGGGSSMGSTSGSVGKKMRLDNEDDFEMEDFDDDEGEYGGPPMLNRQARTPLMSTRRACSPTCTKKCCLTEDGKRVSRQTTTGVRTDQYDPPYNARPSGKRKPRAPKQPSETPSGKSRGPYKKKDPEMKMMMASGGGGGYGSSAPGARSMQAVGMGRPVSAMPPRPSTQLMTGGGGGGGLMGQRVLTIGPTGKVQAVQQRSAHASPTMLSVARPRVAGGGAGGAAGAAAGGGGVARYPVALAGSQQQPAGQAGRMPGPSELVRAESSVDEQYRQSRANFARHIVSGSAASEFNRVIDLLTVENKRLIAAQSDDQEYVDSLNRKIRSLENNVASLQRQLAVTTKAYHGALMEVNAERGGGGGGVAAAAAAAAAPAPTRMMITPAAGHLRGGIVKEENSDQPDLRQAKAEDAMHDDDHHDEEDNKTSSVAPDAPAAPKAAAPAAAAAAASRTVPHLMEQQQQARGGVAAAMLMNRQHWMDDYEDEEEEEEEEEVVYENLMDYFDDEDDEDNMGLD